MTKITHVEKVDYNIYEMAGDGDKQPQLPAGIYELMLGAFGRQLWRKTTIVTDKLIPLKNSVAEKTIKEIDQFLTPEVRNMFKDYQLMYRRGLLMYGAPGTGKTSTIVEVARNFVEKQKGIVIMNPRPDLVPLFLGNLRSVEPDRTVLVVWEELEDHLGRYETNILSMLDGESSVDNVIYLATTNYIDQIPGRIKNRPSRFARRIEIGPPTLEVRETFLNNKILEKHKSLVNIKKLAQDTEGFTIDHLKDLIVSVFCFGQKTDDAVQTMKDMIKADDDESEDE